MSIKIGDSIPSAKLWRLGSEGPETVETTEFFAGRKVVLAGMVGAYSGTCNNEIPTFLENYDAIREKGVDVIACTATSDPFVMAAWEKEMGTEGKIDMLSDGNAEFCEAIGLSFDGSGFGLGTRSKRYTMVVDDGKVTSLVVEENPGVCTITDGATLLNSLS